DLAGPRDPGGVIWDNTALTAYFTDSQNLEKLDWGDVSAGTAGSITSFVFAYATNAYTPDVENGTVELGLYFYQNENGHNTPGSIPVGIFDFTGLPGTDLSAGPCTSTAWITTVVLGGDVPAFSLSSSDLDGDGLGDFGYSYQAIDAPPILNQS